MAYGIEVPGVAVITGSASGIGRAIALQFAEAGCTKLALLDLNKAGLDETKRLVEAATNVGGKTAKVATYICDVSSPEAVASTFAAAKTEFNRIDYAVQCAAYISFDGTSLDCSIEQFDKHIAVSFRGLWLCSREAIKLMRSQTLDSEAYPEAGIQPTRAQRGSIVNISSGIASYAQPKFAAYAGVKTGVLGLTRADAMDFVSERIRVNAVLPGLTDTPSTNPNPEARAWLEANPLQKTPFKRFALPEEIADTTVFLAGNRASYVTGASYSVDGGYSAGYVI